MRQGGTKGDEKKGGERWLIIPYSSGSVPLRKPERQIIV
jgi:hypothetical protein